MDAHLARSGGTQISINTIELAGVGELIEPLPGELYARRVSASGDVSTMLSCLYLYFCAFSGSYYTGSVIDMYNCSPYSIPWSSSGSWKNNQSSGTRAKFYNSSGGLLFTTPGASSEDAVYSWSPVYNVVPC
ncbi:hypothetical protein [Micromonospora sp. CA-111912]|uniref:hypothetical protein n=1 Tax=Micromonospora sp. CA-111912 TaxID=3239955 RepID=UPI003D94F00A